MRMKRTIGLVVALVLLSPATAFAQPPSGMVTFDFGNTIWDVGTISQCESLSQIGYIVDLCLDLTMTPDGAGHYSGTGMLAFTGDIAGTLSGPASGQAKGKPGKDSAKIQTTASGPLDIIGFLFDAQVGFSCSGPIDATGLFTSICKLSVKVIGAGSAKEKALFQTMLSGSTWDITFDFVPIDEKSFGGTATDSFGFGYEVSGKYNEKDGTSKVSAKGNKGDKANPDPSKGAKVSLKNMTDTFMAESKTKVVGSKGDEVVQGM